MMCRLFRLQRAAHLAKTSDDEGSGATGMSRDVQLVLEATSSTSSSSSSSSNTQPVQRQLRQLIVTASPHLADHFRQYYTKLCRSEANFGVRDPENQAEAQEDDMMDADDARDLMRSIPDSFLVKTTKTTHAHTYTYAYRHTHTHVYTQKTHKYTHAHTQRKHNQTHADTHIHTCTHMQEINDEAFPLFITFDKLLAMLNGSHNSSFRAFCDIVLFVI
jgi:hypothetical protein